MLYFFWALSVAISIYSILCLVRIVITWIPKVSYSSPAFFLAKICDPYLNLFRGIKFLRMGSFDFSPALALCVLGAARSLLEGFSHNARINVSTILAMCVDIVVSIINSLLIFVIILFLIRLLMILLAGNRYDPSNFLVDAIDSSISPFVYRIANFFTGGEMVTYKKALIIAIIVLVVFSIIFSIISIQIINLIYRLPF